MHDADSRRSSRSARSSSCCAGQYKHAAAPAPGVLDTEVEGNRGELDRLGQRKACGRWLRFNGPGQARRRDLQWRQGMRSGCLAPAHPLERGHVLGRHQRPARGGARQLEGVGAGGGLCSICRAGRQGDGVGQAAGYSGREAGCWRRNMQHADTPGACPAAPATPHLELGKVAAVGQADIRVLRLSGLVELLGRKAGRQACACLRLVTSAGTVSLHTTANSLLARPYLLQPKQSRPGLT